jgi:hypothetical protein
MRFGEFIKMKPEEIKVRKRGGRATMAHQDKTKFDKKKDRKGLRSNLRKGIHEAQTLTNVRLTNHQKSVLANILARPDQPTTLVDLVSGVEEVHQRNLATAVTTLEQIGLIELSGKELSVTDTGLEVMNDEGMVDESGMLNDEGQKFQFMYTDGEEGKTQQDVNQEMGIDQPDMGMGGDMGEPPLDLGFPESAKFSLRDALDFISEYKL